MKLLDTRTIRTNINAERKVDIDQGIILARKVDTVRQNLAKEEAKWATFHSETIKELQNQIDTKIKERDVLESTITDLKQERTELLKPLDKEWALVKEEREQIVVVEKNLEELQKRLNKTSEDISKQLQEIEIEKKRQSDTKAEIQKQGEQASGLLIEASKRLSDALEEEKRVTLAIRTKMRKASEKEAVLRATVLDIELREKRIKEDEKFISEEKIRLVDQRGVLERAMARTKCQ